MSIRFGHEPFAQADRVRAALARIAPVASPRVGASPSYTGDPDLDAAWQIVAICTSDEDVARSAQIEVAVLPVDLVTAAVEAEVAAGSFRDAVDCAGQPYHG